MRWVQICATDDDPQRYDQAFWMDLLKRTSTGGVCLSAGGVTAFYPTKVPFHYRSPYLGKTDMFGDLTKACKKIGIRVLGRVDPHAMHADALAAHPEWVARNADGTPKKHPTAADLHLTCPNGGITFEWMPKILKEIVTTYPVDGIFGNRWGGSAGICYCGVCKSEFKAASGFDVPLSLANPQAPDVKAYNVWVDEKRYAQLKLWNDTVTAVNPGSLLHAGHLGPAGSGAPALHHPRRVSPTGKAATARIRPGAMARAPKKLIAPCRIARSAASSRWAKPPRHIGSRIPASPARSSRLISMTGWRMVSGPG